MYALWKLADGSTAQGRQVPRPPRGFGVSFRWTRIAIAALSRLLSEEP